ncbi:hypothetical protein A3731_23160 [Roseovarius sp. HI0049]|nr:hypothetical protein A3731_23160 [Roseovarius sp. HI0049]
MGFESKILSVKEAAELAGRSDTFIRSLVKSGYIKQTERGKYRADAVVSGMIDYYETKAQENSKDNAATAASDARTREIEARIAERASHLISTEDALSAMAEITQMFRAEFDGFTESVTRDPAMRQTLQNEVDGIFARLADKAEDAERALRTGRLDEHGF